MAHKNTQVFSHDKVENKLFRASVILMNDSRIHRNMLIFNKETKERLAAGVFTTSKEARQLSPEKRWTFSFIIVSRGMVSFVMEITRQ